MQNKTGGAAFPQLTEHFRTAIAVTDPENPGMTMRQYYKAMVAPAVLSDLVRDTGFSPEYTAKVIGEMADALLAEDAAFETKQQGGAQ